MKHPWFATATVLALSLIGSGSYAQTPSPPPTSPPPATVRPGTLRNGMFRRHARAAVGSTVPIAGGIIGNKRTHVYHTAADRGNMPSEKNRAYFRTEAEAQAAGYHPPKQRGSSGSRRVMHRMGGRTTPPAPPFTARQPKTAPTTPAPNQ